MLNHHIRVISLMFFASIVGWCQATVNENLETLSLYVDTQVGNDVNPGTQLLPLKTIGASVALAQASNLLGLGTRVIINPGTYRETITLNSRPRQTLLPITFQAATSGTVIVSGAQTYTGWTVFAGNSNIYTTAWPNAWGFCPADGANAPLEQPIVLRRELIVVNGVMLTQVLSEAQMVFPGTFAVDESRQLLYVWPAAGTNMDTADVEVGTNPRLMSLANVNNIVFRGITFSYANSCHGDTAVAIQGASSNILMDTDYFIWNGGQGIGVNNPIQNVTITNSVASHNGAAGFQAYEAKNVLWQNLQASYNNWRGAQGIYYEWNTGGAHLFSDHSEMISGFTAIYNQTFGIHWDTDVQDVTVSGLLASNNVSGVLVEKAQGPVSLSGSTFCASQSTLPGEGGLVLRNSENVSVTNSVFYNNAVSQVLITGVLGGIPVTNWETGQTYNLLTQNTTFTGNTVDALGAAEQVFKDGSLGGSDWVHFQGSLISDYNQWWDADNATPFSVPVPTSGTMLSLAGWQSDTGQDLHSTFTAPTSDPSLACTVHADAPDWQLLSDAGLLTTDATGNTVFNLDAVALGSLNGTVTFALDGLASIPGATASFTPLTIPLGTKTALQFTAGIGTPAGNYNFTVLGNSGNLTRTVTLNVTVPVTSVRLSTLELDFGSLPIGSSSLPLPVTLTNLSKTALAVTSIVSSYGFSQTNTCGRSVAAGQKCTINVTFSPGSIAPYSGALTIKDADGSSPQIVTLTGTGTGAPKVVCSPTALYFGNEVFGTPSSAQVCTLTNTGSAPLSITGINITGANPSEFSQTSNCPLSPATLAINATCILSAVFTPSSLGKRTADLSIADNAKDSPQLISLTGTGTTAISVSPKTVNAGNVKVGSSGPARTITITNASSSAIAISSVTLSGSNPADFSKVNNCGNSVAGLSSCTVMITFSPKATRARTATLTIQDSDPSRTSTVSLSGTGI